MGSNFGIGFVVGASLSSSVATTFSTVENKIKATQQAMADTQVKSVAMSKAAATQTHLAELRAQRAQVAARMTDLRQQKAGGSHAAASDLKQAVAQYKALGEQIDKASAAHDKASAAAKKHGVAVADYALAYRKAGADMEKQEARLKRLSAMSAESGKRQALQGQVAGTVASAMTVAVPVTAAMEFETAMADVRKVTNFDAKGLKGFGNELLNMSTRIPLTATALTKIAAAAGQAGIKQEELLTFTEDAAVMATAFDITAEAAGSAMTGMRTNFKLTQDGVRLLGDSINTLSNKFDAKAAELVDFTSRVGGTAASFKMTGHEVAALGTIFRATKVDTESASTAANAMFVRLANGSKLSKDAQAQLKKMGLSGAMLEEGMQKDAQGTLLKFLHAAKGSKNPLALLSEVVGTEHAPKILKIVNSLDLYEEALKTVVKPAENAGSQMEEFKNVTDTAGAKMRMAMNAMNKSSIILGDALLPALSATLQTVTPYISAIGDFASKHQGLTTAVVGAVAGFVALRVASIPLLYTVSMCKTAWQGAALASEFLRGRTAAKTAATMTDAAANSTHVGSMSTVTTGLHAQARATTGASRALSFMGKAWRVALGPLGIAISVFEFLYEKVAWVRDIVDNCVKVISEKFPKIGEALRFLGIGKDEATPEETVVEPTQTAHAAVAAKRPAGTLPPATEAALREAEASFGDSGLDTPSASLGSSATAGGAGRPAAATPVSAQLNFSLSGIPDAALADKIMKTIDQRKSELERLVSGMVNDAVRLAYGS